MYSIGRYTPRKIMPRAAICDIPMTALNSDENNKGNIMGIPKMRNTSIGDTISTDTSIWRLTRALSNAPRVGADDRRG